MAKDWTASAGVDARARIAQKIRDREGPFYNYMPEEDREIILAALEPPVQPKLGLVTVAPFAGRGGR